jgi:hypothetical protein
MLNIPLHALAYVLTPKYYHISWLSSPTPGGGVKRKPHQDPKVQASYMQALDKLVPNEECDTIRRQLSHYINSNGAFGTNHAIRDQGNLFLSSGGTCMAMLPHNYNVWQHMCFHKW